MKNKQSTIYTVLRMLKIVNKENIFIAFLYALKFIFQLLLMVKNIVLPKLIIDEIVNAISEKSVESHTQKIIFLIGLLLLIELLGQTVVEYVSLTLGQFSEKFTEYVNESIAEKCMALDLEQTENPQVLDQMNKAKEGMSWYSGGVIGVLNSCYNICFNIVTFFFAVFIVILYCPILIPVQILALVGMSYFIAKNNKVEVGFHSDLSRINRVFGYVLFALQEFKFGKDFRLYDSIDMIEEKEKFHVNEMTNLFKRMNKEQRTNSSYSAIINSIRECIGYAYVGWLAITEKITIGDFSMCSSAISQVFGSMSGITNGIQDITKKCNYAKEYVIFMDYPNTLKEGNDKLTDNNGKHTIEFVNVSFKYPRSDTYVLKNINLTINCGERLALVGLNGAGKTTLIKLLCRLYDVYEGEILVDGKNINNYSEEEYRKLFAVVFQDFQLMAFGVDENIGFGDVKKKEVEEALEMAGVYDDINKLPKGISTPISKYFEEEGTELSGGQRQKVAIARAIYKKAPIIVLDEPTAALDPISEYDIYSKFDLLIEGKTAIYISHRLSSCKFCDRIIVLSDGNIKEMGTHDQLMEIKDGLYCTMFSTQAAYYNGER
ncbi:MAG: ABC transporter ATP-binding protein/permease [Lachnospiraceae bacterium]|nr:ABC transporter ATP-binding protein/permease [Lachnospiraceae bacterium]